MRDGLVEVAASSITSLAAARDFPKFNTISVPVVGSYRTGPHRDFSVLEL